MEEAPKHALLSASSSHRWLHCPPAPVAESAVPDKGSAWAEEGTLAHAIVAYKLKTYLGEDTHAEEEEIAQLRARYWTEEMEEHTDAYVRYVLGKFREAVKDYPRARLFVESRLDFSFWVPEGFGTGDAVIVSDTFIHIIDLKYGKGVKVEAADNPQLKLYALGALDEYDYRYAFRAVRLTIFQPRRSHIEEWETTPEVLLTWANSEVFHLARLAFAGKGERCPGEWCRFCKVKGECPAHEMMMRAQDPALDFQGM